MDGEETDCTRKRLDCRSRVAIAAGPWMSRTAPSLAPRGAAEATAGKEASLALRLRSRILPRSASIRAAAAAPRSPPAVPLAAGGLTAAAAPFPTPPSPLEQAAAGISSTCDKEPP